MKRNRTQPLSRLPSLTVGLLTLLTLLALLALLALSAPLVVARSVSPDVWTAKDHPTRAARAGTPETAAMPEPQTTQRQLIVDEVKLRLKKIDTGTPELANGFKYQTDIGKNEIDEWATHYQEDELKAAHGKARVSVFDLVRTREKEFSDQKSVLPALNVQVRIYHYRDAVTPADLRKMLADVQQAVVTDRETGKRDLTLGGLAIDIKPGNDGYIIPNEVFTLEGAAVDFNIEHIIDPFGQ